MHDDNQRRESVGDPELTLDRVAQVYQESGGPLSNSELYRRLNVDTAHRQPVGKSRARHSLGARRVRWYQQTLKRLQILEPIEGQRGHWRATAKTMGEERDAPEKVALVAFSTRLGVALWARWESVFPHLGEEISLNLTSPPFPLSRARAYGNPSVSEYEDFIVRALEPIVRHLMPGGTIALNIGQDIFERNSPARSLYRERLLLALSNRLGLSKLDELVWHNPSRPPGPLRYASITRQHLNAAYDPIYLLSNDPHRWMADNRRVLLPHTPRQEKLIQQGGERRTVSNSDGAYRIRPGSYRNPTAGRIPRNVLTFGHACMSQRRVKSYARDHGLRPHGAPMPLSLASFLVQYLTAPDHLVVDQFGGSLTTAEAAEMNGRRWIVTERSWDYIAAGASRFHH